MDNTGFKTTGDTLKAIVKFFGMCKNTVRLEFKPDGIQFYSMDLAHVSVVNGNLNQALFEDYKGNNEVVYLDVSKFDNVVKRFKNNEASVELDGKGGFAVREKNTRWTVPLYVGGDQFGTRIPQFSYERDVEMSGATFIDELQRMLDAGTSLTFELNEDKVLNMSAGDYEQPSVTFTVIKTPDITGGTFGGVGKCVAHYGSSPFEDMKGAIPKDYTVKICFSEDAPLTININNKSGGLKPTVDISWFTAPMIYKE